MAAIDTIAAAATGGAPAAIGIVRVSGPDAISAADKMFRSACGKRLAEAHCRRMYYGELAAADGSLLDMCLCFISRGPDSYTGEDTAEFHCHGSQVIMSEALRALASFGVRAARPGEFTKRAFLNGRMDLTQAEAVIDLIEAETSGAARNAVGQLRGVVGIRLEAVYNALLDVTAHFHAVIDYPDEDIDDFNMQSHLSVLRAAEEELTRMLETHERGRVLRDGVPTVIVGRPNTGKSSLLNALLGYERAIVTNIPGTTRDTIEEKILIGGTLLRVIDTAGVRETTDMIEILGVKRAHEALGGASLAIVVLDGSEKLQEEDLEALRSIPAGLPALAVVNKSDLPHVLDINEAKSFGFGICRASALTGEGFDKLEAEMKNLLRQPAERAEGELITNARQADAVRRALNSVKRSIDAIASCVTPDAVLTDVEEALAAIGEITGKTMVEDVVDRIFERFCVGK